MVIKFIKWLGKNPKKSIFFGSILAYGGNYFHQKYQIAVLMRNYCQEARKYGEISGPVSMNLKKVIVILNPAANKRNAEEDFDEYCAPILNLAGFMIDIVKTQSDMHAISFMEEELKEKPDAILIAGGDGSVSEVMTGLMRREDGIGNSCSIGVLPLGQTNQFSLMLLNSNPKVKNRLEEVRAMADAALAIVKGNTKKQDLMKIELISDNQEQAKTFYAVGSIHWGSFYDILRKKDKYWITGSLRNYTAYLFNGLFPREGITWNCNAKVVYTEPCQGCSNCYEKIETKSQKLHNSRWWAKFNAKEITPEYSKTLNPKCLEATEMELKNSSEFAITTNTVEGKSDNQSKLIIKFNEKADNYSFDFIWDSWKRIKNRHYFEIPNSKIINARQVTLLPQAISDKDSFFAIDNNSFEVRPIKVTVLPKRANFFVQ